MEKKDESTEKEGCCGSSGCSGHHCCGGRTALALVLLLIGGLIGFGIGHCGYHRGMGCPMSMGAPVMPQAK